MCELLGMSANVPTDICFSFTGLIVFLKKMIKVIFVIAVVLIIVLALS